MSHAHSAHTHASLPQSDPDLSRGMVEKIKFPKDLESRNGQSQPRGRFKINAFLSKLVGWPLAVIGGQLLLQVLAWSFFGVVQVREAVPLPVALAYKVKAHPRIVTIVATLISTMLSAISSFLFSLGLSRSLALRIQRPLRLSSFLSFLQISSRKLIEPEASKQRIKWTILSLFLIILTGVQTTAWSTLITPAAITIQTPVVGIELDLASPRLAQLQSSGGLDYCVVNTTLLPAFVVGQTESGYAAAKNSMGFSASLTLMDQTFNVSTAGILPVTQHDVNASSWFLGSNITVLPAALNTTDGGDAPVGMSANYSISQQGFTADVSCGFRNLTTDTTLAVTQTSDIVKEWMNGIPRDNISFVEINAGCAMSGGRNATYSYVSGDPEDATYVLMVACGPDSSANYTLAFVASGGYETYTFMVCSLRPKVTKVRVDYSDAELFAGTIDTTALSTDAIEVNGPAGLSAVTTIYDMMFYAQALSTNIVGDQLNDLLEETGGAGFQNDTISNSLAAYLRGVTEYSGSVLRACLSGKNGIFLEGIPSDMTTNSTGTLYTQTVGWTLAIEAAGWVLIPGALVALLTIVIVLVTVTNHAGTREELLFSHRRFDPSDVMHLLGVSAPGGFGEAFQATEEERGEGDHVVLGHVPGQGLTLIRTSV